MTHDHKPMIKMQKRKNSQSANAVRFVPFKLE